MVRAKGIDISKYDEYFHPEDAIHQVDFVIQRAGYGMVRDQRFDELFEGVRQIPIRGAYHYMSSSVPWRDQADRFLDHVRGRGFSFFVCDYERYYNDLTEEFTKETRKWLEYVHTESGKQTLLYTNIDLYNNHLLPYGDWMKSWDLWLAWYPYSWSDIDTQNPLLPSGRSQWSFWQYTDKANGVEYGLKRPSAGDLDVYNGTVEELYTWLGIEPGEGGEEVIPIDEVVPTYAGIKNQDMINMIFQAAAPYTTDPWSWILKAGLESLAVPDFNRGKYYSGPEIEDLPGLSIQEKNAILEVMDLEPMEIEVPIPTYGDLTNQELINILFRAAAPFTNDPWTYWIVPAGLTFLAIPEENRVKPYTGPKIKDLPGLTDSEKAAILAYF
jgi:GH25 family lysozyme M1 (1,4-beta-N-acetylmuramidase)